MLSLEEFWKAAGRLDENGIVLNSPSLTVPKMEIKLDVMPIAIEHGLSERYPRITFQTRTILMKTDYGFEDLNFDFQIPLSHIDLVKRDD